MQSLHMGRTGAVQWPGKVPLLALGLTLFLAPIAVRASGIETIQGAAVLTMSAVESPCLAGCPRGAPAGNRLVRRQSFVLSNNGGTKFADWAAYVVTPATFGPSRERDWRADPSLPEAETLEPDDYRGAHAALGTDRGHQVPLASFAGTGDWRATNFLSNVTPQKSAMNRGPWARLESAVRRLAASPRINAVHVVTGPLFEREMPRLPNADEPHSIPSGFWKVVAIHGVDGLEAAGYVMDQDLARTASFCAAPRRADLASLERRVGLRLFPDLDRQSFVALMTKADSMARRLGCEN
jgi:endonuclease G, mitochondrial